MIAASANIPYSRSLRPSYICWSADVSGAGFLTTTPNGKASTITTINGEKKGVLSIFLRSSFGRYAASEVRHQVLRWQRLTRKASNEVADRGITVTMAIRKSKESKETSSQTAMDLSLQGKSATPAYMIQKRHMSCAVRPMMSGKTLKKSFRTEVIAAMSQPILRRISGLSLKYQIPPTGSKASCRNHCVGLWREHSHGLTPVADSPVTMRYSMNPLKK